MPQFIRHATGTDTEALYDVCVRTADGGQDARGQFDDDRLWGDLFAVPYLLLAPDHAYVLDDGTGRAVGYALGAADTATFVERLRDVWIPATADRIPLPPDPPISAQDGLRALHYHPEWRFNPELAAYPAHLHIDILPEWQGRGFGRALMSALINGLRSAGAGGIHLTMLTTNTNARRFYDRLGFTEFPTTEPEDVTTMIRETSRS
jgi:ribosomal protein S18 acetylase RimI-like enzyme